DQLMMSRSTPGSRRNSGRSDIVVESQLKLQQQSRNQSARDLQGGGGSPSSFARHPSRASSTMSSAPSTGRHSLDDSYSNNSTSGPQSLSLGRSTCLGLAQNRHSMGNLHHTSASNYGPPPTTGSYIRNSHLAAPGSYGDSSMLRRKSSSALGTATSPQR